MKAGLSLVELATEIQRQAGAKRDFVASTENMNAEVIDGDVKLKLGTDQEFGINDTAHGQIASHLDIPKAYYDRMRRQKPELLAQNVNEWLHTNPARRMVRVLDGKVRAFPSDSYRPLENEDLAEAILPAILDKKLTVMSSQITERRLYIKVVDEAVCRELPEGAYFGDGKHTIVRTRQYYPAITISNSEVGYGSLSIQAGLYDGFCTNLATFNERSLRKYHVGGKHELSGEDMYRVLTDQTRRLTDAATWAQVRDVVAAAFDRARFDALVDQVAGTTEAKIEGDPIKVVELTGKKFGFNEGERKSILSHLIQGGALTQFGLYNAVTRTAQDIEDYDRASEFERDGAKIIELPKNEWAELAKAA